MTGIAEGKQRRGLTRRQIGMLVAGPGRNGEDIALFPVKALSLDDTKAASVNHQVDTATGVLMGLRVAAGAQELGSTAHGGHTGPPV